MAWALRGFTVMPNPSPRTVLIVDSDARRRSQLCDALSFMCWIPIYADTPSEVVRVFDGALGADVVAVIVADKIEGFDAASMLRFIARDRPAVGLVLLAPGHGAGPPVAHIDATLSFPFTLVDVVTALRPALARNAAASSPWNQSGSVA